jgi:signal transduction histidine kinase
MTFATKVTLGIALSLALFAAIGVTSFRSALSTEVDRKWVEHTHLVLEQINALLADEAGAEASCNAFVLTGDNSYLPEYEQGRSSVPQVLGALRQLTADNPAQQRNLNRLEPLVSESFREMDHQIEGSRTHLGSGPVQKSEWGLRRQKKDEAGDVALAMKREEERLVREREQAADAASARTRRVIVLGNLAALILLLSAGVVIHKEMGGRRRAQEEIKRLNHDLQERVNDLSTTNRELDAFTHSLAHDLRAPLRHMHGFAELLRQAWHERLDDDGRYFLGKVLTSSREMGALVDDLLNFSRLAKVDVQPGEVDPRELVDRARRELEPETAARAIAWDVRPLPPVRADPALLYQVLFNLLANAVKYTRKCASARIEVGSVGTDGEDHVILFVSDNGAGFDMQYADKLFRVFQRLHRSEDFEGTGVGLANVRRIIERHGGHTWAEGEVGRGATFYFSLPTTSVHGSANPTRRHDAEQARVHSAGR